MKLLIISEIDGGLHHAEVEGDSVMECMINWRKQNPTIPADCIAEVSKLERTEQLTSLTKAYLKFKDKEEA